MHPDDYPDAKRPLRLSRSLRLDISPLLIKRVDWVLECERQRGARRGLGLKRNRIIRDLIRMGIDEYRAFIESDGKRGRALPVRET